MPRSRVNRFCWRRRIVRRNGVRISAIHVDPQQLSQQGVQGLTISMRVPPAAAVTHADPKHAVRPKEDMPAVVIGEGLINGEENLLTGRVSLLITHGSLWVSSEACNNRVAGSVGVVQVKIAVGFEIRVKRQSQQPLFAAAAAHLAADIQEGVFLAVYRR